MPRNGGLVERNDAKFRQIQIDWRIAGGADSAVDSFAEEDESESEDRSAAQTDRGIHRDARTVRVQRRAGTVHNEHVAVAHRGRQAGFFDALQHHLVDAAIGINVALQRVVMDGFVGLIGHEFLLLGARFRQEILAAQRSGILVAHAAQKIASFFAYFCVQSVNFGLHPLHFVMLRRKRGAELRVFRLQHRQFLPVIAHRGVVQDFRQGICCLVFRSFGSCLDHDAVGLGSRQFILQFFQTSFGKIVFLRSNGQAGRAGVLLQFGFRLLELRFHLVEVTRQPFGGALRGPPTLFLTQFDKFADKRVGKICGPLRVRRFVSDFEQTRVAGSTHRQILLDLTNQFLALGKVGVLGRAEHVPNVGSKRAQARSRLRRLKFKFVDYVLEKRLALKEFRLSFDIRLRRSVILSSVVGVFLLTEA